MNKKELINKLKKLNEIKISMPQKTKSGGKDFNFFEPYIGKQNQEKNSFLHTAVVVVSLVVIFTASFVWNVIAIDNSEKKIESLKKQVESSETKTKLNEIDKLKKKYDVLNKYYGQAYIIVKAIDNKSIISSGLIENIFSKIPKTVSFKSFTLTCGEKGVGGTIDIQGVAESRENIAELQYNLKSIDQIKEVQVNNITEVNNVVESKLNVNLNNSSAYTFSIKCTLKDVDVDEAK